jgi:hypothetical protein
MAVTTTVYDVNNKAWTLTITGTTPSGLTIMSGGIIIESPTWSLEDPIILTKFTFKILGTKETMEQFGVIGETTHSFTLTYSNNVRVWRGYLVSSLFSISNTGFDEEIELNAISDIESLKYQYWDYAVDTMLSCEDTIKYCMNKIYSYTITKAFSFTGLDNLGYVDTANWYDEDQNPVNMLEVVQYICRFYSLILEYNDSSKNIELKSYTELQRQIYNIPNYKSVKHRSIDETYSVGETYSSGRSVSSILKAAEQKIELNIGETNEPPYLFALHRSWKTAFKTHWEEKVAYESRIHVIQQDEYPGWSFPKYSLSNNQEIPQWWNSDMLFNSSLRQPVAGMYGMSYRGWRQNNAYPAVPLTNIFFLKSFNRTPDGAPSLVPENKPFAIFRAENFTATKDNFLLFSGKLGGSLKYGRDGWFMDDNHSYYDIVPVDQATLEFYPATSGHNGKLCDARVPNKNFYQGGPTWIGDRPIVIFDRGDSPLAMSIYFRGKYWSDDDDDWTTFTTIFPVRGDTDIVDEVEPTVPIRNKPFVGNVPLYEELGKGYAVRFGKRQDGTGFDISGKGTLTIKLFVKAWKDKPITCWLADFNFNFVNQKDDIEVKSAPQSPTYSFGDEKKPSYNSITNFLMSEYEDVDSFSQVFTDSTGSTKLSDINYQLPVFAAVGTTNTFNVSERPEQHQLRVIKEVISRQVTLSDVVKLDTSKQYVYNNKLLVRDGYRIDCLNDMLYVNFKIKQQNYTS